MDQPGIFSLTDQAQAEPARALPARVEKRHVPLHVPKTAEIVANQIRKRIIRGELREGDFLPLESQVMASLGISRPTLREALRILEAEKLISVMRGSRSGARIHVPRVESASRYAGYVLQAQGTTVADIYEARLAIEPYVARRLADTRPPGAVDRLRAEADRLQVMVDEDRHRDFMIGLADFHRMLVEESGMQTLLFVTRLLQEVLARYQVVTLDQRGIGSPQHRARARSGINSFRKLLSLIEAGDGDKAEAHWRLHLVNANAAWVLPGETKVVDIFE